MKHSSRFIDKTGKRFGRITVIQVSHKNPDGRWMWLCQCSCGAKLFSRTDRVSAGRPLSCGCDNKEESRKRAITHGKSHSPEWVTWQRIKARCYNKKYEHFKYYGGRGIKVCDRWLNSFELFFKDMGPKPTSKHSIDRINVNGNYEPSNCRWATPKEQAANKRPRKR